MHRVNHSCVVTLPGHIPEPARTDFGQQHLGRVPVRCALVHQPYPHHGRHLHVVGYVQLGGGGRQERGDVDAQQARDGHVHRAQLGGRNAEQQPDARHLVALGKEAQQQSERADALGKGKTLGQSSNTSLTLSNTAAKLFWSTSSGKWTLDVKVFCIAHGCTGISQM